jgi:hypothetical protein
MVVKSEKGYEPCIQPFNTATLSLASSILAIPGSASFQREKNF